MTYRKILLSAAALLAAAGSASAQDQSTAGSMPQNGQASSVTCAQISALDTATVPGVLYFISGYSEGQRSAGSAASGATTPAPDASTSGDEAGTSSDTGADDGAMSDPSSGDSSATSSGRQAQVGTITGYFEIPVEQLMIACGENPDRPVSDMLDEENQRQSTDGSSTAAEGDRVDDSAGATNTSQ